MKKRLEAELISIAHRILKLKNKSEIDQLYKETQKLYDTLAVLKFYHENFESVKSDVPEGVLEEKLEQSNQNVKEQAEVKEKAAEPAHEVEAQVIPEPETEKEEEIATDEEHEETVVPEEPEAVVEESEPETESSEEPVTEAKPSFEPIFELEAEEEKEIEAPSAEEKQETKKVALEHFLGENYVDPIFVKPNEVSLFSTEKEEVKEQPKTEPIEVAKEEPKTETPKTAAVADAMAKSIAIGLNDRIGFVQHLFNNSNEDFNRVISQLNTFDTFEEAKAFINDMVIPDYNYWVGEEDYIERFMAIVEKKFQ